MKQKYVTRSIHRTPDQNQGGDYVSRSGRNPGNAGISDTHYTWTQKILTESTTGNDSIYQLPYEPSSPTTMFLVYINGILQRNGIDYTVSGKTLTFSQNVIADSNIVVFYNFKK